MKKKKILIIGGVLVVLVVIINFIIPAILNPNQYKAEIIKKVQEKTGYKLGIGSDISLSFLPLAKASMSDVTVSAGPKTLASVESVDAYIDLIALFSGDIEIWQVRISSPKITLEKTATGNNWDVSKPPVETSQTLQIVKRGDKNDIKIKRIKLVDGEISYGNKNKETRFDSINVTANLDSLLGPIKYNGSFNYDGKKVAFNGSVENFADPQIIANAALLGAEIKFSGMTKSGKIEIKSTDIKPMLAEFGYGARLSLEKAPFYISGDFSLENDRVNITNIKTKLGSTEGVGAITYATPQYSPPQLAANLKFNKIYVDELLPPAPNPEDNQEKVENTGSVGLRDSPGILADIQIIADELSYKKGEYNNLYAKISIDNKEITAQPLSISLPGGGDVKLFGIFSSEEDVKSFDGRVELAAGNLRKLLEGFDVKLDSFSAGKPGAFSLNSNLTIRIKGKDGEEKLLDFGQIDGSLHDTKFNGKLSLNLGDQTQIVYVGGMDSLNIDDLFEQKIVPAPTEHNADSQKLENKRIKFPWLNNFENKIKINTIIGQLKYDGKNYANVKLDAIVERNLLDVRNFYFNSEQIDAGGKFSLNVSDERPRISLALNIDKLDFVLSSPATGIGDIAATSGERWQTKAFEFSPLDQIDADFKANISNLLLKTGNMTNVTAVGYLDGGSLNIQKFIGNAYEGTIDITGKFIMARIPSFEAVFNGKNLSLPRIVRGIIKNERVYQGVTNINATFKSNGVNQRNMISNLNGNASLTAQGVTVQGFDLQGFAYQAANIGSPADLLTLANVAQGEGKTTTISSVSGNFFVDKGVASTQAINLDTGYAQGYYAGTLDLLKWYMDSKAIFKLTIVDKKESPEIGLKIAGQLDSPNLTPKLDEITRWATDRFAKGLLRNNIIPQKYKGAAESLIGGEKHTP